MGSPNCELAIDVALRHKNALLKFISPNDVGLTGGHQCGFYLPKSVWKMFTPFGPQKGRNEKFEISILWQGDYKTQSVITWYGRGTRSEYRLTKFGREFPFLAHDMVGDLLVLIRTGKTSFEAYILDFDDDIEDVQAALGVQVLDSWGIFAPGKKLPESEDECVERHLRSFASTLAAFPKGEIFSKEARKALQDCLRGFDSLSFDQRLVMSMETEYRLFKLGERQICQKDIIRAFKDVDDFLTTASSILNRRKSRAGRSLENHVEYVLKEAGIKHEMRPSGVDGRPDCVIPNQNSYFDTAYPLKKLFVVGVKTTCKDRWRQVLREGRRQPTKHILTIQPGISANQLIEMRDANVTLVVPKTLHDKFPKVDGMPIVTIERFISSVREALSS